MDPQEVKILKEKLKELQINRIKQCISERGLTQKWVASRMSKTTNTLNGWCCNKNQPHLVDLYLLSAILDCEVKDLIVDDLDVKATVADHLDSTASSL